MKKMAIFVEGYTEVVFVKKLVEEIASNNVRIDRITVRGGKSKARTSVMIHATGILSNEKYYVLIYDCGGDEQVKTRIHEEHSTLVEAGHSRIIGIRDIRGKLTHEDIPRLEANLPIGFENSPILVLFILAIMETEAWFLAETSHFSKIDPHITVDAIKAALGFDPENDDMEQRLTPSNDLNDCYGIGGKTYEKRHVQNTVGALDFARIYIELKAKFPYLSQLVTYIDEFLT